jgi:hypothetical protein
MASLPELDVDQLQRDELPGALGKLEELVARLRLRLAAELAGPAPAPPAPSDLVSEDRAAAIAGVSRRWLAKHTAGLRFRRDLSRKAHKYDEAGLRAWLAKRR